jgi:hypothetical protein
MVLGVPYHYVYNQPTVCLFAGFLGCLFVCVESSSYSAGPSFCRRVCFLPHQVLNLPFFFKLIHFFNKHHKNKHFLLISPPKFSPFHHTKSKQNNKIKHTQRPDRVGVNHVMSCGSVGPVFLKISSDHHH